MMAYQGYTGKMAWDDDAHIFHGDVLYLRDVITFQGDNEVEAHQAFRDSVDDYLEWCAERGDAPETPTQSEITVQVPLDLHRKLLDAAKSGVSWQEWVLQTLAQRAKAPALR